MIDNRTSRITDQATIILSGYGGKGLRRVMDAIPAELTYRVLQRGQEYLAEETLCIEKSATLTLSGGSATEPSGFFRMNFIALPSTMPYQMTEIDIREKERLARVLNVDNPVTGSIAEKYKFFYRYGGTIYTWPALTDGSYTMYYWGTPTTTVDQDTNPETPARMDRALVYWLVREMADMLRDSALAEQYDGLFREQLEGSANTQADTKTEDLSVITHDIC